MTAVLAFLGKLFGIGVGGSLVNTIGGVINHVATVGILIYLVENGEQEINFRTTLGFLALIVGFIYVLLETLRRSKPSGPTIGPLS